MASRWIWVVVVLSLVLAPAAGPNNKAEPVSSISTPAPGELLTGDLVITGEAEHPRGIRRVEVSVINNDLSMSWHPTNGWQSGLQRFNASVVATGPTSASFAYTVPASVLQAGSYEVQTIARSSNNRTESAGASVVVAVAGATSTATVVPTATAIELPTATPTAVVVDPDSTIASPLDFSVHDTDIAVLGQAGHHSGIASVELSLVSPALGMSWHPANGWQPTLVRFPAALLPTGTTTVDFSYLLSIDFLPPGDYELRSTAIAIDGSSEVAGDLATFVAIAPPPTSTPAPVQTPTPIPPTSTPVPAPTPTATSTPTVTVAATPTATVSPTPVPTIVAPTATPTPTTVLAPLPTATHTPMPTATPTASASPTPGGSACAGTDREAEAGVLVGNMAALVDPTASGGAFLVAPDGTGNLRTFDPSNYAEYCLTVPNDGVYRIDARVFATDSGRDSFFVTVDNGPLFTWHTGFAADWTMDSLSDPLVGDPVLVTMTAGVHGLRIFQREDGTRLDRFVVVEAAAPPTDFFSNVEPTATVVSTATAVPTPIPTTAPAPMPTIVPTPGPVPTATPTDGTNNGAVVNVQPGDDLMVLVRDAAAGTEFRLASGVHVLSSIGGIQPKSDMRFIGEAGAVIDGLGTQKRAFRNEQIATGVQIVNLEVRNFAPGIYNGAIDFDPFVVVHEGDPTWETEDYAAPLDWYLENVWVHHNDGDGLEIGSGSTLIDVRSTDNTWLGIGGHGNGIIIDGGELARNATAAPAAGYVNHHSGGLKLTRAKNVTITSVHVHDNVGPGLWLDIAVRDARIANNLVENNWSRGIFYEISYGGLIENNTVVNNGVNDPTPVWLWGGGITTATSNDVVIRNNFVQGPLGGISVIDQRATRQSSLGNVPPLMRDPRPLAGEQTTVTGNTICNGSLRSGVAGDGSSDAVFTTLTWQANSYHNPQFLHGTGVPVDLATWQGLGHDTDGTTTVHAACPSAPDPRLR